MHHLFLTLAGYAQQALKDTTRSDIKKKVFCVNFHALQYALPRFPQMWFQSER